MAKSNAVWGIDIGQCALKALRCTNEGDEIVADAFDYIEYPKILSQPEAEPDKLINEALQEFLSRNDLKDAKIAMSVPGQSGLAKFFKPPPVDAKRIPDIVKYEARQQIPFDLDDVIWDFQQMGGGSEVDGFALETEVGLFAMKRDQVFRQLRPFERLEVELDIVQLAPLCIYNFVAHDVLGTSQSSEDFDPEDPPESLVVLSIGTETTDLVVTNGYRLWQRSIPLGGNHFTKQLTKEMKLTFAKAEHLKRNARQAEDPKAVFQAMRSVFNDFVTEIQRSIGYFQGIDRKAKIGGVVLLGNTVKLPGLKQYLAKNLGYEVVDFESFSRLTGASVVSSPAFKDNLYAFGVSYGLCLQGLGQASLSTNLVPREIIVQRMIREKKPWALASAAALLLACSVHFAVQNTVWKSVHPDRVKGSYSWQQARDQVQSVQSRSGEHDQKHGDLTGKLNKLDRIGREVASNADRRLLWPELLSALNSALPTTSGMTPGVYVSPKQVPLYKRDDCYLDYVESKRFEDLKDWYTSSRALKYADTVAALKFIQNPEGEPPEAVVGADGESAAGGQADAGLASGGAGGVAVTGPSGPGWVIELGGFHYHNHKATSGTDVGRRQLYKTLINRLENGTVELPTPAGAARFSMKELGIGYAIIVTDKQPDWKYRVRNPAAEGATTGGPGMDGMDSFGGNSGFGGGNSGFGAGAQPTAPASDDSDEKSDEEQEPQYFTAPKYEFTVQVVWQEKLLSDRMKEQEEKRLKQQQQQQQQQQQDQQQSVAAATQGS